MELLRNADAVFALAEDQRSAVDCRECENDPGAWVDPRGELQEGRHELQQGLTAWRASGETIMSPYQLCRTAEGFLLAGDQNAARALLEEAFTAQVTNRRVLGPCRVAAPEGELQAVDHQAEQAEQSFREALAVARGQGAKWFELRVATGLAALARTRPKPSSS